MWACHMVFRGQLGGSLFSLATWLDLGILRPECKLKTMPVLMKNAIIKLVKVQQYTADFACYRNQV